MGIFSFFKKPDFFSADEKKQIEHAIHAAEQETCGQIRVYIESKNYLMDPVERAKEVFAELNMQATEKRNAVLIYIAVQHRELAIYADEGVYQAFGATFWNNAVQQMISHFKNDKIAKGIEHCIEDIGHTLKEKFPCGPSDTNQLPDDIIYGK